MVITKEANQMTAAERIKHNEIARTAQRTSAKNSLAIAMQRNTDQMRQSSAKYAHIVATGEIDAGYSPVSNITKTVMVAEVEGIGIPVELHLAKFGNKEKPFRTAKEARFWIREQHEIWKSTEGDNLERKKARCRVVNVIRRATEVLRDFGDVLGEGTTDPIEEAMILLGIACESIGENGEQL
jgi:hypothetical protein